MKLLRTVTIKEVVTAEKKEKMIREFELEINQYKRELEQLTFQLYKATRNVQNKQERQSVRIRYNEEINKRKERLESINFKVQQLHKLELGTEIHAGTAESIVEVNVGERWPDGMNQTELVIRNGIIHEIREGRKEDE